MPKPPNPADSWKCTDADAREKLKEMFVDIVQKRRIAAGQKPALRASFLKVHGVAHGRFEIRRGLPKNLAPACSGSAGPTTCGCASPATPRPRRRTCARRSASASSSSESTSSSRTLEEMKKVELSVLTTTYWSGAPYKFGIRDVKYKLEPGWEMH